ncbi:MAG TPA: COX15/CtaA family protein [Pseudoneobacillus sp.]|nr:COX15/CtaA family protein [Pseudoneobacillus sp.]
MIKRTAFLAIVVTYILIVFGGYVATSKSGMGCGPEWPLCNGKVIPNLQGETLIEFTHRFIGLLLVILTAILFIHIRRSNLDKSLQNAAMWMVSLLTIQVLAGAVIVILDLPTIVVTLHLIVAMLFILNLLWIFRRVHQNSRNAFLSSEKQKNIIAHLNVLMLLVLFTIGLGAYIKHQHYGLACDWLDCRDTWLPLTVPEALQSLHRIVALITAAYTIMLTVFAFSNNWGGRMKRRFLFAAFIVLIQIVIGVLTIMTNISTSWAVIHLATGTALFMVVADTRVIAGSIITKVNKDKWMNPNGQTMDKN